MEEYMGANWVGTITLGIAGIGTMSGCVAGFQTPGIGVYADTGYIELDPPALQREEIGIAPYNGYIWIDGYWMWNGGRYQWQRGHWEAPRQGYRWAPHRWEREGRGWRQHGGRWERH